MTECDAQRVEIHYVGPPYPLGLVMWRHCKHPAQFRMFVDMTANRNRNGGVRSYDMTGQLCFACGQPLEGRHEGSIFNTLADMLGKDFAFTTSIRQRIEFLQRRWLGAAMWLFGPDGWIGRREKISRMIDPDLTLRISETWIVGDHLAHLTFSNPQIPADIPVGRPSIAQLIRTRQRDAIRALEFRSCRS